MNELNHQHVNNKSGPKDIAAIGKVPLQLIPGAAAAHVAVALAEGAEKYGPFDWRKNPVLAMTYVGAAKRHIDAWVDGLEFDPSSTRHPIAHAIAGLMILLDAMECGQLIDDRPVAAPTSDLHEQLRHK